MCFFWGGGLNFTFFEVLNFLITLDLRESFLKIVEPQNSEAKHFTFFQQFYCVGHSLTYSLTLSRVGGHFVRRLKNVYRPLIS